MYYQNDILFDKYVVVGLLGSGAYGEVYKVRHKNLNVFRAIKCIRKCQHGAEIARREADILKNLRHPSIPIIYDVYDDNESEYYFIIEEFVEGVSLRSFISKQKGISLRLVTRIGIELCDVVEYLNENDIFHCDIKPDNIMLDHNRLVLIDYGSATKSIDNAENVVRTGTKGYAAPELYGKENVEAGSDVYSIGMVLLYAATKSENPQSVKLIADENLQKTVNACLSHSVSERIGSAKKLKLCLNKTSNKRIVSKICFVGNGSHQGTTACAFMAYDYLTKKRMKTLLCEENESGHFGKIIGNGRKIHFENGIFTVDGRKMKPNYRGYAEAVIPDDTLILSDFGRFCKKYAARIKTYDVICVVTGVAPYELDSLKDILEELKGYPGKIRVLLNHANAKDYKNAIRKFKLKYPARVPYSPGIFT